MSGADPKIAGILAFARLRQKETAPKIGATKLAHRCPAVKFRLVR